MIPFTSIITILTIGAMLFGYLYSGVGLYLPVTSFRYGCSIMSLKGCPDVKARATPPSLPESKPSIFEIVWSIFDDEYNENHSVRTFVGTRTVASSVLAATVTVEVPAKEKSSGNQKNIVPTRTITVHKYEPMNTTTTVTHYQTSYATATEYNYKYLTKTTTMTKSNVPPKIQDPIVNQTADAGHKEDETMQGKENQEQLSPAEMANQKNYVWFTIPLTGLRLAFYVIVPFKECKILEYDIPCWPTTQESVDWMLKYTFWILGPTFVFLAFCINATIMDSLWTIKSCLAWLKRRLYG
ncbi:hypothetical protein CLU79DRAFT_749218 [Phycomyces nitens]|nr:hypothetical protein CLU79DRAFT_749218 [Phycomyces nitens]